MERLAEASAEGTTYQYPIVTIVELGDDGGIRRTRSYYDKLAILQRVASKYPASRGGCSRSKSNSSLPKERKDWSTPRLPRARNRVCNARDPQAPPGEYVERLVKFRQHCHGDRIREGDTPVSRNRVTSLARLVDGSSRLRSTRPRGEEGFHA